MSVNTIATKPSNDTSEPSRNLSVHYDTISIQTAQENLTTLDHRLAEYIKPSDFFYIHDLTAQLKLFVAETGVMDGVLTVQILHTSATLSVNELDEPMLLMDIVKKLRTLVPREEMYFHNSALRVANRCDDDAHCDRNADAHVKSTLFGSPSVSLIVRNGELVVGQWQKVSLIEFDGPRKREVLVQLMGG